MSVFSCLCSCACVLMSVFSCLCSRACVLMSACVWERNVWVDPLCMEENHRHYVFHFLKAVEFWLTKSKPKYAFMTFKYYTNIIYLFGILFFWDSDLAFQGAPFQRHDKNLYEKSTFTSSDRRMQSAGTERAIFITQTQSLKNTEHSSGKNSNQGTALTCFEGQAQAIETECNGTDCAHQSCYVV